MPIPRTETMQALENAIDATPAMLPRSLLEEMFIDPDHWPKWEAAISKVRRGEPISTDWEDDIRTELLALPPIGRKGRTTLHIGISIANRFRSLRDNLHLSNDQLIDQLMDTWYQVQSANLDHYKEREANQ